MQKLKSPGRKQSAASAAAKPSSRAQRAAAGGKDAEKRATRRDNAPAFSQINVSQGAFSHFVMLFCDTRGEQTTRLGHVGGKNKEEEGGRRNGARRGEDKESSVNKGVSTAATLRGTYLLWLAVRRYTHLAAPHVDTPLFLRNPFKERKGRDAGAEWRVQRRVPAATEYLHSSRQQRSICPVKA